LAPDGDDDEQDRGAGGEQREDPGRNGTRDRRFAEEFLALGVDRFLPE
jgi:hypothetical protein